MAPQEDASHPALRQELDELRRRLEAALRHNAELEQENAALRARLGAG